MKKCGIKFEVGRKHGSVNIISLPSEYLAMIAISDKDTYLLHLDHGEIKHRIRENLADAKVNQIESYIAKHNKLMLCFSIHESLMKLEKKMAPSVKDAKSLLSTQARMMQSMVSFGINITNYKLGKQTILTCRIDRLSAHHNVSHAYDIAVKAKNKILNCNFLINALNSHVRNSHHVQGDRIIVLILITTDYFVVSHCIESTAISIRTEKDIGDAIGKIDDEMEKVVTQYSRPDTNHELGLKDHIPDIFIITDLDVVKEHNFKNPAVNVSVMMDFFEEHNRNKYESIFEFIGVKSVNFTSRIPIRMPDLSLKRRIYTFFSLSKIFFAVSLIVNSAFLVNMTVFQNTSIQKELNSSKNAIKNLEKEMPKGENRLELDAIKDLSAVYDVSNSIRIADWISELYRVTRVVRARDFNLIGYTWECSSGCLKREDTVQTKLGFHIKTENPSGFAQNLHFKITDFANFMLDKFGFGYDISGLDYKYKFSIEPNYPMQEIEFSMMRKVKGKGQEASGVNPKDLLSASDIAEKMANKPDPASVVSRAQGDAVSQAGNISGSPSPPQSPGSDKPEKTDRMH